MTLRRKSLLALLAIPALALLASVLLPKTPPPPISTAVTISFSGFTNLPGHSDHFARFVISNTADYAVRMRGFHSEIQGSPQGQAPLSM